MSRTRRSAFLLILAGLLAGGFFYLTDPRLGPVGRTLSRHDVVDAVNQAAPGTFIGLAGSAAVLLIGLWLMTRRAA